MLWFPDLTLEEAEAYRDAYLASLPGLVERLQARVERTGGPALDGSVVSLGPLGEWFCRQLAADEPDGMEGYPAWWVHDPNWKPSPVSLGPQRLLSDRQLRLVDEVGAYFAQVLQRNVPQLEWVVFRPPKRQRNAAEHETMLQAPNGLVWNPVSLVYSMAIGQELHRRAPEPDTLLELAERISAKSAQEGAGHG
ncbi:MAG: hypothetical protein ACLGIV_00295 [Actinomycetes bacterium]